MNAARHRQYARELLKKVAAPCPEGSKPVVLGLSLPSLPGDIHSRNFEFYLAQKAHKRAPEPKR